MEKDLGVLVIHGMGSQESYFADPLIEEVSERLGKSAAARVAWAPVYWQDILKERQSAYMREAKRNYDVDAIRLRNFVVSALGDAAAYQKVQGSANQTYERIHEKVASSLHNLADVQLAGAKRPIVVVAHSLGGHIMSNFVWDRQHDSAAKKKALGPVESMQTLAGMVTFGCNIPLFTFAYDKVEPIKFPGARLSAADKRRARWLNFYDPDDILGYPLKALPAYRKVVHRDIPINAGGIFSSWNPASHSQYWTDNDLTRPLMRFLRGFIR
jgi:alpha-beta hydrolase superfamily lysophospholipase